MSTLYVDRRDASLDVQDGTLVVRLNGARIAAAPLALLERVVLRGHMMLSTSLISALYRNGAGLFVLSGRTGEPSGSLLGRPGGDALVRLGQMRLHADPQQRLALAQRVVRAKLSASLHALEKMDPSPGADRRALLDARRALPGFLARAAEADSIAALTGIEGAAAAAYFRAFGAAFPPSLRFAVRSRRPPRDPANALLSLGYTLATFEAARCAVLAGLDPLIGFLHALAHGRPSLACDLVEPARPRIDLWALSLFREHGLRADHFRRHGEACLLGKAGRALVYQAWEEHRAVLLRRAFGLWCRSLARTARAAAAAEAEAAEQPEIPEFEHDDGGTDAVS
jgi:CRISPR-associated protein Cas1